MSSGILTLICLVSHSSIRSEGGTYGIGGQATDFPFLHSKGLRPSGGDLRLELMAYCQSEVSRMRCLKDNLGGTRRILCTGSAQSSAGHKILVLVGGSLFDLPGWRRETASAAPELESSANVNAQRR